MRLRLLGIFVSAVIEEDEMNLQRKISIVSSLIYCTLAIGLILWKGSVGLICCQFNQFRYKSVRKRVHHRNFSKSEISRFKWPKISQKIFRHFYNVIHDQFSSVFNEKIRLKTENINWNSLLSINVLVIFKMTRNY